MLLSPLYYRIFLCVKSFCKIERRVFVEALSILSPCCFLKPLVLSNQIIWNHHRALSLTGHSLVFIPWQNNLCLNKRKLWTSPLTSRFIIKLVSQTFSLDLQIISTQFIQIQPWHLVFIFTLPFNFDKILSCFKQPVKAFSLVHVWARAQTALWKSWMS